MAMLDFKLGSPRENTRLGRCTTGPFGPKEGWWSGVGSPGREPDAFFCLGPNIPAFQAFSQYEQLPTLPPGAAASTPFQRQNAEFSRPQGIHPIASFGGDPSGRRAADPTRLVLARVTRRRAPGPRPGDQAPVWRDFGTLSLATFDEAHACLQTAHVLAGRRRRARGRKTADHPVIPKSRTRRFARFF